MVTLNKIYTKTGDSGETSLVGGLRVAKHSMRPEAFGEIDELNSILGLVRTNFSNNKNNDLNKLLERIQNELFDLGADLATPEGSKYSYKALRISKSQVERLEKEIDFFNKNLRSFREISSKKIDFTYRSDALARPGSRELLAVKIPPPTTLGDSQNVEKTIRKKFEAF